MDLEKLAKLKEDDPKKYWEIIAEIRKNLPDDERSNLLRIKAGKEFGPDSFRAYSELIHGNVFHKHNDKQIDKVFKSFDKNEIYVYLGFRGCRKTITVGVTLGSYLLGHFPNETAVITGAADPNAKLIAKSIAQIIELHPEFQKIFPHVIPYKERGWGAEGYWVRDSRVSVEEWARQQAKVNDPSFVGGGYKSSEINGKHPSLFLLVDDLHDIDSSVSVSEREYIKKVFFTQIMPTVIKGKTKIIMTGVPFANDDTYATLKTSSGVEFQEVPVMKRVAEGTKDAVYIDGVNPKTNVVYDDIVGWWSLTEPELMNAEQIINERSRGKGAFWQMYMIDIAIAKSAPLMYYLYPHDKISYEWPTVGGADPTNVEPDKEVGGQKGSNFALCYLSKTPEGGAVVVDGVLKRMGIVAAKDAILQAQSMFRNWRTTGVENVGGGAVFLQYLRTDPKVRCQDSNLSSPDHKRIADKKTRFLTEVHPWLEGAVIRISDLETPYNMALRNLCDNFWDLDVKAPEMDAGDALYHAAKLIPEILRIPNNVDISPEGMNNRKGLKSAWSSLGG